MCKATGNGVTDDTPAIQAEINKRPGQRGSRDSSTLEILAGSKTDVARFDAISRAYITCAKTHGENTAKVVLFCFIQNHYLSQVVLAELRAIDCVLVPPDEYDGFQEALGNPQFFFNSLRKLFKSRKEYPDAFSD